jgi:hypothetical protein
MDHPKPMDSQQASNKNLYIGFGLDHAKLRNLIIPVFGNLFITLSQNGPAGYQDIPEASV